MSVKGIGKVKHCVSGDGALTDRIGSWLILSVKVTVTIGTMIIFDCGLDGDGDVTCKQTFSAAFVMTTCYIFLTIVDKNTKQLLT